MTVGNPENFKVKITTGRDEVDTRKPCDFSNLNIKKLCAWIDNQPVNSTLKSELKRSASSYPHQALPNWKKNFSKHVSRIQNNLNNKKFKANINLQPAEKNIDINPVVEADVQIQSVLETNIDTNTVVETDIELQSAVETNFDTNPVVKNDINTQSAVETNFNVNPVIKNDINTQSTVETNVDANYVVKNDFELQSITSQASGKTNLSSTCSPQGFSQSELENNLEVSQKAPTTEEFE